MNDALRAVLPLLIFALAFILLIVLPARARTRAQQQTQKMQEALTVGTEVMTTSGLYGTVAALRDDTVELEVSPGVVVRFARAAISTIAKADDGGITGGSTDGEPSTIESSRGDNPPGQGYAKD